MPIDAMIGVGSAGFAITPLPADRAAEICPVKIARGKFQGEMQLMMPRSGHSSKRTASSA